MEALDLGRRVEVRELRLHERGPDRDRPGADPQLVRELGVDALAVLDELVVAVLEARSRDERRPLAGERLGPVERLGDAGDAVVVDEVVAGVAAGAPHQRVRQVDGRREELCGVERRGVVRSERRSRVEVAGEVDEVVLLRARDQPVAEVVCAVQVSLISASGVTFVPSWSWVLTALDESVRNS